MRLPSLQTASDLPAPRRGQIGMRCYVGLPWAEALGEITQPILSTYAKTYPNIHLLFSSMDPSEFYNGLRDNTVDIALARLPSDPEYCTWTHYSKITGSWSSE
jgi:DNA-binding transcriptional LysR family regulator